MDRTRREALKTGGRLTLTSLAMATGLIKPNTAQAAGWNKGAFEAKTIVDTVKALGGATPAESKEIELVVPDIAENGALVPISVNSKLAKTQSIALMVEKNPNTLSAIFDFPPGTDPFITTRVKMAETSKVSALVIADGRYYITAREVRVTLGGCA